RCSGVKVSEHARWWPSQRGDRNRRKGTLCARSRRYGAPPTESRVMTAKAEANPEWTDGVRGPGLLAAMRQHPFLVVFVTIAAGAAGYAVSQILPTTYQTTAHLFLANRNEVAVFRTLPNDNAALQATDAAELMRSDEVLNRTRQILHGRYSVDSIKNRLTISPSSDSAT